MLKLIYISRSLFNLNIPLKDSLCGVVHLPYVNLSLGSIVDNSDLRGLFPYFFFNGGCICLLNGIACITDE